MAPKFGPWRWQVQGQCSPANVCVVQIHVQEDIKPDVVNDMVRSLVPRATTTMTEEQ